MSSENKVSAENNTLTESKKNSKAGSNKHRSGKSKSKKTRKNCVVLRYILPSYYFKPRFAEFSMFFGARFIEIPYKQSQWCTDILVSDTE